MGGLLVQYGGGNIGRGFIGPLFSRAGFEVAFIDIDTTVISALNGRHEYTVEIVSNDGTETETVTNIRGVNARDAAAVRAEIARADVLSTAVGVNALPGIALTLAAGLKERFASGNRTPLNIIICENIIDADKYLAKLITETLNEEEKALFHETVGLVEASIGRMVPVITPEDRDRDPLLIRVERYCELPVNAGAIKGTLPEIEGLHPFSPFDFYVERKIYLHNMSHALTAYLGFMEDCEFIWQACSNSVIALLAERAMLESATALSRRFDVPLDGILEHIADLLLRYKNRELGDTVARVGRDTYRKLGEKDRFAGAIRLCMEQGVAPVYICAGLAAAVCFDLPDDEGTGRLRFIMRETGTEAALERHSGIAQDSEPARYISRYLAEIDNNTGASGILRAAESLAAENLLRRKII